MGDATSGEQRVFFHGPTRIARHTPTFQKNPGEYSRGLFMSVLFPSTKSSRDAIDNVEKEEKSSELNERGVCKRLRGDPEYKGVERREQGLASVQD